MKYSHLQQHQMDLEITTLSQRQMSYHLYVESNLKKKTQMNLFIKNKTIELIYRYQKQTHDYQRENVAGRVKAGAWNEHTHTTICKIDNQQEPTV